jgi:hypothetical protein
MRIFAALLGLGLLSACNVVVTQTPLFTADDEAAAPRLKPGVWLAMKQGDCRFDESKPIDTWPECAGGAVVKVGELVGYNKKEGGGAWEHDPFILAAGDPRIGQIRMTETLGVSADAEASGGATATASATGGGMSYSYGYVGVRVVSADPQGLITAVSYWPVMCGPPPPKNKKGEDVAMGTLKPLPGMVMKPGDGVCSTTSKAVIHSAARASIPWGPAMEAHWIRDGDR